MTAETVAPPRPLNKVLTLCISVIVVAISLMWAFLSMRAVMGVGGACADGDPYVNATPCPDGAWLISVGIPLLLADAFLGSFAATSLGAPDLVLPMWFLLFGSLGANFLEFGLWSDPWVWGWIVCGVVFELMALPALYLLLPIHGGDKPTPGKPTKRSWLWWSAYLGLALVGFVLGYVIYQAAS